MYRFRELLHIYITVFVGIIMAVISFFIPPVPLSVLAIRFIIILLVGLVVGLILRYYVDSVVPPAEETLDEAEPMAPDEHEVLYDEDGNPIPPETANAEGEFAEEEEEGRSTNRNRDENSIDGNSIDEPDLTHTNTDEYLDEDFLQELEEEY